MTNVLAGALALIVIVLPDPGDPQASGPPDGQTAPSASAAWFAPSTDTAPPSDPGGSGGGGAGVGGGGIGASRGGIGASRGGQLGGMPGAVRLEGWKLTIPVASDKGTAASVNPANGAPPWLVLGQDGSATFWAPVSGATTPNSKHARTELVSLRNFRAGVGWHTLRASLSVAQVPKQNQDIIIGQIHGAQDINAVPFVMLHYTAGTVHVVVKQGQSGSASDDYPLISGVPLGARFDYTISDTGDGNLRVTAAYGSTTRTATAAIPAPFRGATVRFQAGDYQQAEYTGGGSPHPSTDGDGGRVTFYALDEAHAQGTTTS